MFLSKFLIGGLILLRLCYDDTDPCEKFNLKDPYEMNIYAIPMIVNIHDGQMMIYDGSEGIPVTMSFDSATINKTIVVKFYKKHCGNIMSQPMEYRYLIRRDWIESQIGGIWEIHVDNSYDEILIDLQYEGDLNFSDKTHIPNEEIRTWLNSNGNFVYPFYICLKGGRLSFFPSSCKP